MLFFIKRPCRFEVRRVSGFVARHDQMSRQEKKIPRKPATKYSHLRKKLDRNKIKPLRVKKK
jgi:hypothetical protein